jgi:hypothetical protein
MNVRAGLIVTALGVSCMVASTPAPRSIAEQYLYQAANAERMAHGLQPLRWDPALFRAADAHAAAMAQRQSISHQYPGEADLTARGKLAGARFSTIAENVAMAPTAVRIQDAWMNSPGHRANLLDATVDSVGIRVLQRNGELYAVEDFDRSVDVLTLDEQEARVGALVTAAGHVEVLPSSEIARRTCTMETGYAGSREPWFVMRYTATDLTQLPEALRLKLSSGKFQQAMVGACPISQKQEFTAFKIAVMLYP